MSQQPPGSQPAAGSVESLYPFLYAGKTDVSAVLEQVRQSTVAKAAEILELRRAVLAADGTRLTACARDMASQFGAGGRLLAFGNGGSATDAQQLVTLFLHPEGPLTAGPAAGAAHGGTGPGPAAPARRPLPALSLASDSSVLTALSNDIGVDVVFARQIAAFGGKADIAVGLSTSGNSENLLRAFNEASRRGMLTIGIAGYAGGKMAELDSIDYLFVAPSASVHRIQEAQTTMYHALWELCLAALGPAPSVPRQARGGEAAAEAPAAETPSGDNAGPGAP
ncbi:MAG TPA: SIS domain-containing protein [Streptosporangiaceae bacterium]|nr:SIS domain-containing protein [Streptosporangiaceae bacterium]